MMNDEQIQAILNALPDRRPHSRLEPYAQLIDQLRKLGRTYREIEQILSEKCDIRAPRSTINDFVRRRRGRKAKIQKSPPQSAESRSLPSTMFPREKEPASPKTDLPEIDKTYRRIAALKQRKPSAAKTTDLFHYDPNEPLHLPKKPEPEKASE